MSAESIREKFQSTFGPAPEVVVSAPGRVTLIGEHTNYAQLQTLPIAIDRPVFVAAGRSPLPGLIAESTAFPGRVSVDERGRPSSSGWVRYLAALANEMSMPEQGIALSIDGDIPMGGGLGASSALLLAMAASIDLVTGKGRDRETLAAMAARAEQRVGSESAGADEQVISFAEAGSALRLDFAPTRHATIAIPADWRFIVASSGEGGASESRQRMFNERLIGARLAAALLAEMLGTDPDDNLFLGDIASADVVDILAEELPGKTTIKDVARTTGVQPARLGLLSHSQFETQVSMPVRGPALHILSEAQRVDNFEAAMRAGDGQAAGTLLTDSHTSLRESMGCSTQRLDRLCKAMREAGAWGARLTGRGFGGFALALCSPDKVEAVLEAGTATYGGPAFEVTASDGWRSL